MRLTHEMDALAVLLEEPQQIALGRVPLNDPVDEDVVVDIEWSGISSGTERLLWLGQMPAFPGMGYPLIPGYESVGRVVSAPPGADIKVGSRVFVPGARCFGHIRGLFGGAASRVVVPVHRVVPIHDEVGVDGILLALAATAHHILGPEGRADLVVGHGVLGRLIARLSVARGGHPIVWETEEARLGGAEGYTVLSPSADSRSDYRSIIDVSGDASILDGLIERLGRNGEIILAGFYRERPSFSFPPAFMKEARLRVAAEWQRSDLDQVYDNIRRRELSLAGLITHQREVRPGNGGTSDAYQTAFNDPTCLKMVLDWRTCG